MSEQTPLEIISDMQDLIDLHEFMQDPELLEAMEIAVKCIANPNISVATARNLLIKMQAMAFKFRMQSSTFSYVHKGRAGTDENAKKNVYYSASDQCDKMAQTLKYLARDREMF